MNIVDKLLEAEGAIQSEAYDPDLDKLLHKAAAEVEALAAVNAELLEALDGIANALESRCGCNIDSTPCGAEDECRADLLHIKTARAAIAKARGDDNDAG